MTNKQQTLREAFEEYMTKEKGADEAVMKRIGDGYMYAQVDIMWQTWKAAARWADK